MKYSSERREAYSEALDFFSGRFAPRLLLRHGADVIMRGANIGGAIYGPGVPRANTELLGMLTGLVLAAGGVSVGMGLWAIRQVSGKLLTRVRRPTYYPVERRRRERLANERRRIRDRFTTGKCPKAAELLAQYAKARTGAREALLFGSMLCDLEAYCDNSLVRNADGEIVGRNPGVKGWIRVNCAKLLPHYANAMRYKALAEKFRRAAGAADPIPAAVLLAPNAREAMRLLGGKESCKITVRNKKTNGLRAGKTACGTFALELKTLEKACESARVILNECENDAVIGTQRGTKPTVAASGDAGENEIARTRSGTKPTVAASGDAGAFGNTRTRCGILPPASRETCGNERKARGVARRRRGSVAKLEAVLGRRQEENMACGWRPSHWRSLGSPGSGKTGGAAVG